MLLPPNEYALATTGAIAPALRHRSSVYYWSHGAPEAAQSQARHEAMCSKKSGWHLRTFGSHGFWAMAAKEKCGPPNSGIRPSIDAGVIDTCAALTLDDLPADWRQAHFRWTTAPGALAGGGGSRTTCWLSCARCRGVT